MTPTPPNELVELARKRQRANGDWNINDWKDFARVLANALEAARAREAELRKALERADERLVRIYEIAGDGEAFEVLLSERQAGSE